MSSTLRRFAKTAPIACCLTMSALLGSVFIVAPLGVAHAQSVATSPTPLQPNPAAAQESKPETVEMRIANLHSDLQITPTEEADWKIVAQTMRDDAANMESMRSDKSLQDPNSVTAMQNLATYQKFAEAHLDELKRLVPAFQALYDEMPDAQKKITDRVFQSFDARRAEMKSSR
jgi:hypothetical protein